MKRLFGLFVLFLAMGFVPAATGTAASHGGTKAVKAGILLVAFGTSEESAQVSFDHIETKVRQAYPDIEVRWAYTSTIIRRKLAGQGKQLDSPEIALAKMADDGFTHVVVQSLHTIAGAEYHDLRRVADSFAMMGGFERIAVGDPMMATQDDMKRTVEAMLAVLPGERQKDEAVVFMGHGTHHPANAFYAALNFQVQRRDPNLFIGTVEGYPELDTIIELLRENSIKKVYLMPLMSVAGDHAKNDMAGDDAESWKSVLTAEGFEVEPILKGTAEFDEFVAIWVDHIGDSLNGFR